MESDRTRGRTTPRLYAARPTITSASRPSMTDEMKRLRKAEGKCNQSRYQVNKDIRHMSAPVKPVSKLKYETIALTDEPSKADKMNVYRTVEVELIDELAQTNVKDKDTDACMSSLPKPVAEQNGTKPKTVLQNRKIQTPQGPITARPIITSASRASMVDEMKRINRNEGKCNQSHSTPLPTAMPVPRYKPLTKTSTRTLEDKSKQPLYSGQSKQTIHGGTDQDANSRSNSSDWNYKHNTTFYNRPHSVPMSLECDYAYTRHTVCNTFNDAIRASIIDEENRKEKVRKESEKGKFGQEVILENVSNTFEVEDSLHQENNSVRPLSAQIVAVSKLKFESINETEEPSYTDELDDGTVEFDLVDELQQTNVKNTVKDKQIHYITKSVAAQNGIKHKTALQTRKTGTTEKQNTSLLKKNESKVPASKPKDKDTDARMSSLPKPVAEQNGTKPKTVLQNRKSQAPQGPNHLNDNLEFYKNKMSSKPFPAKTTNTPSLEPPISITTTNQPSTSTTDCSPDWIYSGSPEEAFHTRHAENRLSMTYGQRSFTANSSSSRDRLQTATVNIMDNGSDDVQIQQDTVASLLESGSEEEIRSSKDYILLQLHSAVDHTRKKNIINVTRQNVFDGAMRGFRRRTFDAHAKLHLKFVGEDRIDDGGLTREFMRLLRKSISQQPIFCGDDTSKQLALDASALEKGVYRIVGEMLAYMLVHRGPIPNFLDPLLYDVLSKGIECVRAEICNVVDNSLREQLEKIVVSTSASDFFNAVRPLEYLIRISGNASLMGRLDRKDDLVGALCQYLVVDNMKPAYAQFAEGLNMLGVLNTLKTHCVIMKQFFVFVCRPLKADDILNLYKPENLSAKGSNRRQKEDETISWWRDFVLDIDESENLPALLAFMTGLDEIPPLGFDCDAFITFRHREDFDYVDLMHEFPIINTCSLELRLPILDSYDMFVNMFTAAMSVNTFTAI